MPVPTKLSPLERRSDLRYGGPMPDPTSGLHVPIMGVTLHPQTGVVLPVAGSHDDPVTRLSMPIEVGSVMLEPSHGKPVPIVGVTLDGATGNIICNLILIEYHSKNYMIYSWPWYTHNIHKFMLKEFSMKLFISKISLKQTLTLYDVYCDLHVML